MTGSEGTPYANGLWRLHLKIPPDYPKNPPKATFKTRIYHPNVEESTGVVCLETLKRDWDPKLTLKDILITISCLLIQPNPDSALNSAAGALIQEDYNAFSTQAKLMTSIHAPIPKHLADAVRGAKRRGEEDNDESQQPSSAANSNLHRATIEEDNTKENEAANISTAASATGSFQTNQNGKRPLAQLASPGEGQNEANPAPSHSQGDGKRRSPKVIRGGVSGGTLSTHPVIYTDQDSRLPQANCEDEKENVSSRTSTSKNHHTPQVSLASRPTALRKVSNVGVGRKLPRVGIRRL